MLPIFLCELVTRYVLPRMLDPLDRAALWMRYAFIYPAALLASLNRPITWPFIACIAIAASLDSAVRFVPVVLQAAIVISTLLIAREPVYGLLLGGGYLLLTLVANRGTMRLGYADASVYFALGAVAGPGGTLIVLGVDALLTVILLRRGFFGKELPAAFLLGVPLLLYMSAFALHG